MSNADAIRRVSRPSNATFLTCKGLLDPVKLYTTKLFKGLQTRNSTKTKSFSEKAECLEFLTSKCPSPFSKRPTSTDQPHWGRNISTMQSRREAILYVLTQRGYLNPSGNPMWIKKPFPWRKKNTSASTGIQVTAIYLLVAYLDCLHIDWDHKQCSNVTNELELDIQFIMTPCNFVAIETHAEVMVSANLCRVKTLN